MTDVLTGGTGHTDEPTVVTGRIRSPARPMVGDEPTVLTDRRTALAVAEEPTVLADSRTALTDGRTALAVADEPTVLAVADEPTVVTTAALLAGRTPIWRLAITSFVPTHRRALVDRVLHRVPITLILVTQVILTLRLHNIANSDEALYITAGHEYLRQWSGGPPAPAYGGYFSGFPWAYPVFAAVIDSVGGLVAVRAVSLIFTLSAVLCVAAIGRRLAMPARSNAAGLVAAAAAVLAGPTLFVGNFATFDAACVVCVIGAAALAVTRNSYRTAVVAGVLVGVGGVVKYTAAPFLGVVAALALFAAPTVWRGVGRAAVVVGTALGTGLAVYLPNRHWITAGIEFTTANRAAENYRSLSFLLGQYLWASGLLTGLALVGFGLLVHRTRAWRPALLGLTLLGGGAALALSQAHLHEYTSFNKHLVFGAMFLAPLVGQLAALRPPVLRTPLLVVAAYLLAVTAMFRSDFMFQEWPDSTQVLAKIQQEDRPGRYIGVGADTMGYYSTHLPELTFEEPWALYGAGPAQIRAAIAADTYAGIFFTSGPTGSAGLDADTALVAGLLRDDPHYELVGTWPKHEYDQNKWYLYLRTD